MKNIEKKIQLTSKWADITVGHNQATFIRNQKKPALEMKYPQGEKQHLISEIVTLKINNWTSSNKSTLGKKITTHHQ